MKVLDKSWVIVTITTIVTILLLYGVLRSIITDTYSGLEQQRGREHFELVMSAFDHVRENLDALASDWGSWDEAYEFMAARDQDFVAENIVFTTFSALRLNLLIYVSPSGEVIAGSGFDLAKNELTSLPGDIQRHLVASDPLVRHRHKTSRKSGFLVLPSGIMLVASRPVLTSTDDGPVRGALIMGRYMTTEELTRIGERLRVMIDFLPLTDTEFAPYAKKAVHDRPGSSAIAVDLTNRQVLSVYAELKDLYGETAFGMRVRMGTKFIPQAFMTLHLVLLALVAAGSIQATVTIVLLRRSELAQRKSEERYRSIVEDQTELICRFRPDMVLTFVNQAYCNCFGKTEAELIGKSFLTLLEEDQQQEIMQDVARLTPASPVARRRQRVVHSDGRTAWQDWTNRALFDDTGRLTEFQAVGRDITELVAAHDELRAVTSRLENVIESSPAVIYTCHPYGDFGATFVSGNVKRQLGYEPEAFTENPRFWIDNIHPDDVSRVKDGLSDLFTYGDHVHEYRFRHQSGFYRWMRDELRLTRDPEGNPTELFGTWVDITDRKYAEYAMMESEQRLELALEGGGLGLWDHHLGTGRIVYDRRWAEMLGYDVDYIDQHVSFWGSLIHPDDLKGVVQAFNDHVLGEAPHYAVEHRLRTKSGEWKWIFSKGKVVRWDSRGNPSRITGTHLDISDRKRVEERLRESLDEKQVLLQEIHHRCKNNLQIMASLLDMQSGYVYDENCAKMLGEAQNRIWAMALVHEKLFESTGLASLAVRDYMANLIDELLASFGSEAAGISVHLDDTDARFDIETAVPVGLLTNELVTNAIKHAFPPGGKGEIRLGVRRCNDDRFELEVSDNGTGLPADMEQLEGASFGFRLIRTLVRQLRGDLEYRSENGAEFRIRFVGVGPRQKR